MQLRKAAIPAVLVLFCHGGHRRECSNEGMKWYEVVPIAAVVGATQAATGHRDQDTNLFIEAELIDAKTNQTVAKVVRKVFGSTLENESQNITAQDFKAAIDKLNVDLWAFIRS
ncbi:hypothetical protein D3C76_544780 [compost metagenome]